jgi:phage FluMu protein Com
MSFDRKPAGKDLRYRKAVEPTRGLNPFVQQGRTVRFRCGSCGCLLKVAVKDIGGEWEKKCPACGMVHVVNRKPAGLDSRQQAANERMMLAIQEALKT